MHNLICFFGDNSYMYIHMYIGAKAFLPRLKRGIVPTTGWP